MSEPGLHEVAAWFGRNHRRLAALRSAGLVVKLGGSIQDDPAQLRAVCRDVAALASLGARPVIVHGGGKAITAAMNQAGLQSRFVQGQRYTDEATLKIAERVLAGVVNREIVGYLHDEGARAEGLHSLGQCVLQAQRAGTDPAPGRPAEDLGLVGRVTRVNSAVLLGVAGAGVIPVIAPIAAEVEPRSSPLGKLNVNADLAGGTVAAQLQARIFVLVSDTPGVRTDPNDQASYAPRLSRAEADELTAKGIIAGGMLPKLSACFEALAGGVREVCIVDGRRPHALLGAVLAGADQPIDGTRLTN